MILLLLLCPSLALAQEATTQSVPVASSSNSGGYVYRFWSDVFKGHFFTSSVDEANKVNDIDKNWKYESIAFNAFNSQESGSIPLYRFWSDKFHGHFYTADASEMTKVRDTDTNWTYEKIAFYVYPLSYTGDSKIVYRFWSPVFSHHFYTADEGEMARVRDTDANWVYEGPAYRVPNTLGNDSTDNNSNNNQDNDDNQIKTEEKPIIQTADNQPVYDGFKVKFEIPSDIFEDTSDMFYIDVKGDVIDGYINSRDLNTGKEETKYENLFQIDSYDKGKKQLNFYYGWYTYPNLRIDYNTHNYFGYLSGNDYLFDETYDYTKITNYTQQVKVEYLPIEVNDNFPKKNCLIKGVLGSWNYEKNGSDIYYYLPSHPSYKDKRYVYDWICTEKDAQDKGYIKALRQ
jgi:hypothetical protein